MEQSKPSNGSSWKEKAQPISDVDKSIVGEAALRAKVELFKTRLSAIADFENLSTTLFRERLPGYQRLMPLLSMSVVDICSSLLHRYSLQHGRTIVEILTGCARCGVLPEALARDLGQALAIIDMGIDDHLTNEDLLKASKSVAKGNCTASVTSVA